MKVMFVEAHSKLDVSLPGSAINKLPKTVALVTTVQHICHVDNIKKSIEETDRKVVLVKGKHSKHEGQMLGCDVFDLEVDAGAFLYIGTGEFHPKQILIKHDRPVFVFNPMSRKFYQLKDKHVRKLLQKQKGAYLKFLDSDEIGIIISTKPGQNYYKEALALKDKYKEKNFYYLIFNTINFNDLENFPFIDCFVNAACPRIGFDDSMHFQKSIINIENIL